MGDNLSERMRAAKASAGVSASTIYDAVLRELQTRKLSGHILDFGAGTGELAQMLCGMEQFQNVTAADILDYGHSYSHPKLRWLLGDLNNPLPANDASFDAVVAVEVIEHLENPRAVAREMFRLLRPNGVAILTTPNSETWRSIITLIVRGYFNAFGDQSYPAHITALLRKDLHRICNEAGFEEITFAFANNGVLPKFTSITWQAVSFGLLRGLRFSDNFLCIARKPAAGNRSSAVSHFACT